MKKKIALLSSLLTIVVCLAIITGSTFALFTDRTEMSIAVTSADVELNATIGDLTLYSAKADANGALTDEYGKNYSHEDRTALGETTFTNGGTATYDASTGLLDIKLITPGDKVSFPISAQNESTVRIQYRYVIKLADGASDALLTGDAPLEFRDANGNVFSVLGTDGFASDWMELAPGADMPETMISVELPVYATSITDTTAGTTSYENLTTSFVVLVEAVQYNANV